LIVILIGMSPVPAVIGYNIYEDWSAREAAPSDLFRYNLNPDEPIPGSVASLQVFTSHDEDGGIGLISFEISLKDLEHLLAQDKFKLLSAQTRPFKVGQAYTQLLGADYQIYTKSEGEGVIDELLVAKSRKKCVLRQIDNR
jgi:hypothetical protein